MEYTNKVNAISKEIQEFVIEGKKLCSKLKTLLLNDMTKYKELTFLYGEYMTMLNQMLSKFGKVQKLISQFKNEHQNGKRKSYMGDDTSFEIQRDRKYIERSLEDLITNKQEMLLLQDKIKTTMEE